MSLSAELAELDALHKAGTLDAEEFKNAKAAVIETGGLAGKTPVNAFQKKVQKIVLKQEKKQKCVRFAQNKCSKGDACIFSHDFSDKDSATAEICIRFSKGDCKKGDDCIFNHNFDKTDPEIKAWLEANQKGDPDHPKLTKSQKQKIRHRADPEKYGKVKVKGKGKAKGGKWGYGAGNDIDPKEAEEALTLIIGMAVGEALQGESDALGLGGFGDDYGGGYGKGKSKGKYQLGFGDDFGGGYGKGKGKYGDDFGGGYGKGKGKYGDDFGGGYGKGKGKYGGGYGKGKGKYQGY